MKHFYNLFFTITVFTISISNAQTSLAEWNFTGDLTTPNVGAGTISNIGGTTNTFASGSGSSDPDTTTANRAYNTTAYAALGAENKLRGIQISVSTVGFQGISIIFDQRLSNTANNTYVVQYTTNGATWVDAQTFTFIPAATGTGDTWYNLRTVNLSTITALNNNANTAFRIVSSFDPTTGNYLAARSTSTYSPNGTVRYDNIKVIAQSSLSAEKFEINTLKVYPNPISKGQKLYFNENLSGDIIDINGRSLKKIINSNELNMDNINSGIYFIKTDKGSVEKFIVN